MICKREEVELVPLRVSYWATWGLKVRSEVFCRVINSFKDSETLSTVRGLKLDDNTLFRSQLEKVVTGDL